MYRLQFKFISHFWLNVLIKESSPYWTADGVGETIQSHVLCYWLTTGQLPGQGTKKRLNSPVIPANDIVNLSMSHKGFKSKQTLMFTQGQITKSLVWSGTRDYHKGRDVQVLSAEMVAVLCRIIYILYTVPSASLFAPQKGYESCTCAPVVCDQ